MGRDVVFYFSVLSPWVYFAGPRFHDIARAAGARIAYRPIDLMRVFRETGGTPLAGLHPTRQAHRARERERWSQHLGMPIRAKPAHHPVDESLAAQMLLVAQDRHGAGTVWPFAQALLEAVWRHDQDISARATLLAIADGLGLGGQQLMRAADTPQMRARFEDGTTEAMAAGVFGVPTFAVDGDLFFGQDRLDFVERALRA
jgi:carboxymethylenebutenolidase